MKKNCESVVRDGKGNGRAGNVDAVTEVLKGYLDGRNPEARSFALGLCRDADEADELVQEACYRALKAITKHDATKSVKSWLFTILRNAFMDTRRRMERRKGVSLDYRGEAGGAECFLHETLATSEEPMLDRLERAETSKRVRQMLARLPRKEREAITLCLGRGLRYDAVARNLRLPLGTVRSRVFRGRAKLRRLAVVFDLA